MFKPKRYVHNPIWSFEISLFRSFQKLRQSFSSKAPDVLYALINSVYWKINPNCRGVLTFPIRKNLWLISYDGCKFFVNRLRDGLGYLAPFEPYERYFKIKAGDVVVDVGACVGGFAIPAARKCGKRGIVIAIEPDQENVNKLRENILLNKLNNIIIVPKAAWNLKGMVTLYHGKSIDSHTLIPNVKVGSHTITSSSGKSRTVLADTLSSHSF